MKEMTFVCTGTSSEITNIFFPPIELDRNKSYRIGLLSLSTFNSVPNIRSNVNDIFEVCNVVCKPFEIPQGAYELSDLKDTMLKLLKDAHAEGTLGKGPPPVLKLVGNPVTKRATLFCNYTLDFSNPRSFSDLMGFDKVQLEADITHESPNLINISPHRSITVECNIAKGSYRNGRPTHEIYQFVPNVPSGYAITEQPNNVIYFPLNTQYVDNLTIRFVNGQGDAIDFGGENVTVRLHIKE